MCTSEHPGVYGAYRTLEARRGIKIKWIELPSPLRDREEILDLYRRAMIPRTRAVVASHITFVTGLIKPSGSFLNLSMSEGRCCPSTVRIRSECYRLTSRGLVTTTTPLRVRNGYLAV